MDNGYLITGANGFLGRHLVQRLERDSRITVGVDSFISSEASPETYFNRKLNIIHNDFMDFGRKWVASYKYPTIFHLAGIASPHYYRKFPLETMEASIDGTKNILELAKLNPETRVVVMSSSEIYGDPDPAHVPTDESYRGNVDCLGPRACYDEGKRVAETLARVYTILHGVKAVIIRPFNAFGPGMNAKDYRVMPQIREAFRTKTPVKIFGTGTQTRTFCYVDDLIDGIITASWKGAPGSAYNLGNDKPEISMVDLCKLAGVEYELVEYPDSYPGDEPQRRCPDLTKARTQLGYEPKVSLEAGLRMFLDAR